MKIIYMHHAERKSSGRGSDPALWQMEDLTEIGVQEAQLLAQRLKGQKITAIVTSPYLRCRHTAQILNQHLQVPIIEDSRLNEWQPGEGRKALLERNMAAIDDLVRSYQPDDTIICITSGVNVTAFICNFYGIEPTDDVPVCQAADISPLIFIKE